MVPTCALRARLDLEGPILQLGRLRPKERRLNPARHPSQCIWTLADLLPWKWVGRSPSKPGGQRHRKPAAWRKLKVPGKVAWSPP